MIVMQYLKKRVTQLITQLLTHQKKQKIQKKKMFPFFPLHPL